MHHMDACVAAMVVLQCKAYALVRCCDAYSIACLTVKQAKAGLTPLFVVVQCAVCRTSIGWL
jgi:hypothetical protein